MSVSGWVVEVVVNGWLVHRDAFIRDARRPSWLPWRGAARGAPPAVGPWTAVPLMPLGRGRLAEPHRGRAVGLGAASLRDQACAGSSYRSRAARQPTLRPPRWTAVFSDGAGRRSGPCSRKGSCGKEISVIILGIILIVVGLLVASLKFLLWVGIVLVVVGLVLNFLPIGGRRRRIF